MAKAPEERRYTGAKEGKGLTDRARLRRFLGWTSLVLIVLAPLIAAGSYEARSASRRGKQAEEWFQGLKYLVGADQAPDPAGILIGWFFVAAGVGTAIAWFLIGRTAERTADPVPPQTPQAPGAQPANQGPASYQPPTSTTNDGYTNPFNPPRGPEQDTGR